MSKLVKKYNLDIIIYVVKLYRNNLKFIAMDFKYNTNHYKLPFFSVSTLTSEGHI